MVKLGKLSMPVKLVKLPRALLEDPILNVIYLILNLRENLTI